MRSTRRTGRRPLPRRGLTFLEVVIAASILAIAAIAVLELLASSDAVGLESRRRTLAAAEAERLLELCADAVRNDEEMPPASVLQAGMRGEALLGCVVRVRATDITEEFAIPSNESVGATRPLLIGLRRLELTVESPNGDDVVTLERYVPLDGG